MGSGPVASVHDCKEAGLHVRKVRRTLFQLLPHVRAELLLAIVWYPWGRFLVSRRRLGTRRRTNSTGQETYTSDGYFTIDDSI